MITCRRGARLSADRWADRAQCPGMVSKKEEGLTRANANLVWPAGFADCGDYIGEREAGLHGGMGPGGASRRGHGRGPRTVGASVARTHDVASRSWGRYPTRGDRAPLPIWSAFGELYNRHRRRQRVRW